ncbi:FUSC family protein [Vibrio zhugei]|uniref:FUSC family protein n=1 Tax=Vibrio zhugei TaxID=2479546 RepID=A0ABV7C8A2_9VIBR|nr:FUSC family protein [Vibrio zhugei]
MQALFNSIFFPESHSVRFAIKGVIAMALSLYLAMFLNLDRPYWALIGAIFLQIRPESGLVIEKGLYQILGTIVGGIFAIVLLEHFSAYPYISIGCLAVWLGINSGLSALVRRVNLIYAFAMAGMTACLIVLLVMIQPSQASSTMIFATAQARMSEIIVGVICAALVSTLIWPISVSSVLRGHARTTINKTLHYLCIELDPKGSHEARHEAIDSILESLTALNDDSTAVTYEGPLGPGRSRASNLLSNKILSLLSLIQIFGRVQRNHPELVSENLSHIIDNMHSYFVRISQADNFTTCHQLVQELRREQVYYSNKSTGKSALEVRLLKIALELTADLIVILKSYDSLTSDRQILLNAPRIKPHHDPLVGVTTGLRSAIMFLVGASLWIGTGSSAVLMMMILPVVFSIMMARLPMMILTLVLRRILVGLCFALPLAIFYALPLLAESSGDYELLVLILSAPYFVGLLALSNRPTLPYGLGILIPFTIFVRPSPGMSLSFQIDSTVSYALAIFVGVSLLYWLFKLITGPSLQLMMNRLINNTYHDLIQLPQQTKGDIWFNSRMGDRLLRISTYEKGMTKTRNITDLALTALNIGHVSLRLRKVIQGNCSHRFDESLDELQQALADAFYRCYHGLHTSDFTEATEYLFSKLPQEEFTEEQYELIRGSFERLSLTLARTSENIAQDSGHQHNA